jgi:hypothetical protein
VTAARIGCVVEGHGEVEAVPMLIRRIAQSIDPPAIVDVRSPVRASRYTLIKPGQIERAVDLAARKVGTGGRVLVLVDADTDLPCVIGPELLRRAQSARTDRTVGVVVAKCEFEAWFLAAAHSLRGKRGLPVDLEPPPDPEAVRGAKEWLSRHMGRKYSATLDQPAFTRDFDLTTARRATSFDKCFREIVRLVAPPAANTGE